MQKGIKILLIVLSIPVMLFIILMGTYIVMNWQGVISPYHIGKPDAPHKVLIASQGSKFKSQLLEALIRNLRSEDIYLSIIDCTSLKEDQAENWNAIVIIHTTKVHQIPKYVKTYLDKLKNYSNVILISTSGGGDEIVTGYDVDAISTASRLQDIEIIAGLTDKKIKRILEMEGN
jgi:hypothetical protein